MRDMSQSGASVGKKRKEFVCHVSCNSYSILNFELYNRVHISRLRESIKNRVRYNILNIGVLVIIVILY